MSSQEFDGLVAVVTGGASGIGDSATRALQAEGAKVAVLDLNPANAATGAVQVQCDVADDASMTSSVFSGLIHPRRALAPEPQADTARLTNALKVVVEVNSKCWRGEDCELCSGVNQGMSTVASHTQQHGDVLEHRVSNETVSKEYL